MTELLRYKSPEYGILKTALEQIEQGRTVMFLASCALAAGMTHEQILTDFPYLTEEDSDYDLWALIKESCRDEG